MTDRLGEIQTRLDSVRELGTVVTAMRGVAASRLREARERLAGIRAYAAAIGSAIGDALVLRPALDDPTAATVERGKHELVVLCGEQGFVGTLNERIMDTAARRIDSNTSELFVVGARGQALAAQRGLPVTWSTAMASHAEQTAAVAIRIADALYQRIDAGRIRTVTVIHAGPSPGAAVAVEEHMLIPLDLARFPHVRSRAPPLISVEPQRLIEGLTAEYIYAELSEAAMLSFAAENEARMLAMIKTQTNIDRIGGELQASFQRLRQEQITAEIVDLANAQTAITGNDRRYS